MFMFMCLRTRETIITTIHLQVIANCVVMYLEREA